MDQLVCGYGAEGEGHDQVSHAERVEPQGGAALRDSPVGLAGYPVYATFLLAGAAVDREVLEACRAIVPAGDCKWGMSAMDDVLVVRGLGRSAQSLREYFMKLWARLRPGYARASAHAPRIWAT